MTTDSKTQLLEWRTAAQRSFLRWPAGIALAVVIVTAANLSWSGDTGLSIGPIRLHLSDALCIFSCMLVATWPIWYVVTSRAVRSLPGPTVWRQLSACAGLFVLALLAAPRFTVDYRDYDSWSDTDRRDFTTTWVKRSLLETMQEPRFRLDELAWMQSNFSASYIPAQVYCPRRSTRFVPFFGVVRDDYVANALASGIGDEPGRQPPAAALSNAIARCKREGPQMLAAGDTKEAALMKGDVDRFFSLAMRESPPDGSVVLEDAMIPKPIMDRIEAVLKDDANRFDALENANASDFPGQVRRLRPLAVALALGRSDDAERLRKQP